MGQQGAVCCAQAVGLLQELVVCLGGHWDCL